MVFFFEFSAALGCSDLDPVDGAVAASGKPLEFDEGFQKDGAVAVAGEPVGGYVPGEEGEQAGGEVAGLYPRWDQEAVVVDDQVKAGAARRVGPTDKAIPSGDELGAGTETRSANNFAAAACDSAVVRRPSSRLPSNDGPARAGGRWRGRFGFARRPGGHGGAAPRSG